MSKAESYESSGDISNTPRVTKADSSQRATYLAYGGLVIVAGVYGCWSLVAHEAMSRGANPLVFAFYRLTGCAASLIATLRLFPGLITEKVEKGIGGFVGIVRPLKNDTKTFLLLGLFMGLNILGMLLGSKMLPALTYSVFQPSMPVFTMMAAWLVGMEAITPLKVGSILCAVAGAVIIILFSVQPSAHPASSPNQALLGLAFVCLNVSASGAYIVLQKKVLQTYSPVLTIALSYLVAAILIFVPALASAGFDSRNWLLKNDSIEWMAEAYAIFLNDCFNMSVMAYANKITTPTTVTMSNTLQPLFAALVSFIFLHTAPNQAQVAGGLAIVTGLVLYVYVRSQRDFGTPSSTSKDGNENAPLDERESGSTRNYGANEASQP